MSAILDYSRELAAQGVRFFPVTYNSKIPAIKDFSKKATNKLDLLEQIFKEKFNSGIACGFVSEGLYLVGLDIDNKEGRNGYNTMAELKNQGFDFPETWAQKTTSGGEHRLFWSPVPIRQGVDILGIGVDTRGDGGYLVGPGSVINGRSYTPFNRSKIALLPDWAINKYRKTATVLQFPNSEVHTVGDQVLALKRSVDYLRDQAVSRSGNRNDEGYRHACKLKDFGLAQEQMMDMLRTYWKCEPMLEDGELIQIINSAFKYGKSSIGIDAPENIFDEVKDDPSTIVETKEKENYIDELNKRFFYAAFNGTSRVYWETQINGKFHLEAFPVGNFHEKYNHLSHYTDRGRKIYYTEEWMASPKRRTYDFIRFDPANQFGPKIYNRWRGFAVKPHDPAMVASDAAKQSVQCFIEHVEQNICRGEKEHAKWLMGYFAHLFQYPGEKPHVALVFRGGKGVGKSIVIDLLSHMIGDHAMTVSDKRYLVGNFNSVLEDKLLFSMDEAFWSGDKAVDGILKHAITGNYRVIERKGSEPYNARVFDRIVIIGNEKWIVPASADERRFAVFDVGDGRKQDRKFFKMMKEGIEKHGGAELLMRYFLDLDISDVDINQAPHTQGLADQKEQTLGPLETWWKESLESECILGDINGSTEWPTKISSSELFECFKRHCEFNKWKMNFSTHTKFTQDLSNVIGFEAKVVRNGKKIFRGFNLPLIEFAQMAWDKRMGYKNQWNEE